MKVITIIENNHVAGVVYGLAEVADRVSPIKMHQHYAKAQLYKKAIYANIQQRTRKK